MMKLKSVLQASFFIVLILPSFSQNKNNPNDLSGKGREHLLMDFGWRFALGNAKDYEKDYSNGTSYFTYLAKTGYGDGAAAQQFEDRTWREVDLPHDWAVELPFSSSASHSHGYKTIGWKYPETSVGWYRKKFHIPASDLGRKISIQFDGIHRNSTVWVNGFYVGNESSGYASSVYDITDYLNYGEENVVAVRVDASIEEGWYYEGAGIYRHVWLNKTDRLHVAQYGTFVLPI
jgi:Beta-galactosidase/beta-glucuronidase